MFPRPAATPRCPAVSCQHFVCSVCVICVFCISSVLGWRLRVVYVSIQSMQRPRGEGVCRVDAASQRGEGCLSCQSHLPEGNPRVISPAACAACMRGTTCSQKRNDLLLEMDANIINVRGDTTGFQVRQQPTRGVRHDGAPGSSARW